MARRRQRDSAGRGAAWGAKRTARLANPRAFALQHRTLLVAAANGIHADISRGAMPFEERSVDRASPVSVAERRQITTCSAEALVVHKAFAARDKDGLDIAGVVTRQGARLDRLLGG